MGAPKKTEIHITGQLKATYTKVEKKYYKSIRIPTGDNFFIQTTFWVPFTPGYSKLPKVVLSLSNHREKIQILFPSALDLMEFADILQSFAKSELKEINQAHIEATRDYQIFHEILEKTSGTIKKAEAEQKFQQAKAEEQEQIEEEKAPF